MNSSTNKKSLDFHLDLIPVISLFSVCICFLLLVAVWVQVGTVEVRQAMGGQAQSEAEKRPIINIKMLSSGDLEIEVKDFQILKNKKELHRVTVKNVFLNGHELVNIIDKLKTIEPTLRSAIIEPYSEAEYEKIVYIMDLLRVYGVTDLGVTPL
ncbi:MAG: biopolymer transporter ExbD [Bdellovibrionaceae bacterium]|nr:biopolymer transporter ExbD [Pseudobdellovibrionaceae bacterium]MDW8191048.1 biopolymer transporter ExbD [Pseudobdellovibrionaceae bacterium]